MGENLNVILPSVDVGVAVIVRGDKILSVYNHKWGSFTLPMSKLRKWQDPQAGSGVRFEAGQQAACRAAAETLGRTLTVEPETAGVDVTLAQSDSDLLWKRYSFRVFKFEFKGAVRTAPGVISEWLTKNQFLDPKRWPISDTARHLVRLLAEHEVI